MSPPSPDERRELDTSLEEGEMRVTPPEMKKSKKSEEEEEERARKSVKYTQRPEVEQKVLEWKVLSSPPPRARSRGRSDRRSPRGDRRDRSRSPRSPRRNNSASPRRHRNGSPVREYFSLELPVVAFLVEKKVK